MSDNNNNNNNEEEYESYCYLCRRSETVTGPQIKLPNNISVCKDCMQKSFDTFGDHPLQFLDFAKMPNINLSQFMNFDDMFNSKKVKKKKKDKPDRRKNYLSFHWKIFPRRIKLRQCWMILWWGRNMQKKQYPLQYIIIIKESLQIQWMI